MGKNENESNVVCYTEKNSPPPPFHHVDVHLLSCTVVVVVAVTVERCENR